MITRRKPSYYLGDGLMKTRRIELLGVPVDCLSMNEALSHVDTMLSGSTPQTVIAVNPEKIMAARQDPFLLKFLQTSSLLIPDGIGVSLAAKSLGLGITERVAGSDLMPNICELAAKKRRPIFIFGATPLVNRRAVLTLQRRYPGIQIAGHHHGYVKEADMPALIDSINTSGAEILFVALGSPRQERWIAEHLPQLKVKVCQGIGGTLDVLTGNVKRAPEKWRSANLEWLYRLMANPQRAFRQLALPHFTYLIFKQRTIG